MSRRIPLLAILLLAATTMLALTAIGASNCTYSSTGFTATVTTSVYDGPPPVPLCLSGVPIVKVDVSIKGHGQTGSTSQLRCGALSDPVTLTVAGFDHSIAPASGNDWQDALGSCNAMTYEVN